MALLRGAVELARTNDSVVYAATVDHGLRPEAREEAAWVAQVCADLGVQHKVLKIPDLPHGTALPARARDARYRALSDWAATFKNLPVLLGHTRDDVAETFLMRIARGAGTTGLAQMAHEFDRHGVRYWRPLLQLTRPTLRSWLEEQGQTWVNDPTNDDDAYDRVKMRNLLPLLAETGLSVDKLASAAGKIRDAETALDESTLDILNVAVVLEAGDAVLDLSKFHASSFERRRRVIMALLRWVGGKAYDPRGTEQWRLLQIVGRVEGPKNVTRTLSGVLITRKDDEFVRFSREFNAVKDTQTPCGEIWDNRWALEGPHAPNLTVRALGEHIKDVAGWRETGLPRASLMATPAVFDGETLISAPIAGLQNGFNARIVADFTSFLRGID